VPAWIDGITAEDVEAFERGNYLRFFSIQHALMKVTEQTWSFPNFGSSQWAILPQESAKGRVIHVEETHMPWANRCQNCSAHLLVPSKLNVGGISWFGSPFFLEGFNERITWSATWNQPDISDVYEEKINPGNDLEYLYEGKWLPIHVEHAVFQVRGPNGMESVPLPLYYTHHGPIREDPPGAASRMVGEAAEFRRCELLAGTIRADEGPESRSQAAFRVPAQ